jgi:hypothetical protein
MDRFGPEAHGLYEGWDLPDWANDLVEADIVALNPFSQRARGR